MLEPEEPGQGEGVLGDEAGEVDGPHQGRSFLLWIWGFINKEAEETDWLEQLFSNHHGVH